VSAIPEGQDPSEWKLPDLRVDVNGDWYDGGVQVTHGGILANLRSNLRRDADGYFIQTRVRIPVRVDDVPFTVTRIEREGDGLAVWLNDDTRERIDGATLRVGRDEVPYCPVKAGTFEARLTRPAAYQLWAISDADESLRARLTGNGVG
jgi:uncharacterized protein